MQGSLGLRSGPFGARIVRAGVIAGILTAELVGCGGGSGHVVQTSVDSLAPTVPSALHATVVTEKQVVLAWSPSTDLPNPGGTGIAGYHVYRNGTTNLIATVNATSFTDDGLMAHTGYTYQVSAVDQAAPTPNESPPSQPLTVTTNLPADTSAPTVPSGVKASAVTSNSITLTWNASTDLPNPGAAGVAGYYVYRNGVTNPIATVSTTSYTDTGLASSTGYTYQVAAFDRVTPAANVSALSTPLAVTTQAALDKVAPTVPSGLKGSAVTSSSVTLTWNASTDLPSPGGTGVGGYYVYRDGATNPIATVSGTSFTDTGLVANTYAYQVAAFDRALPTANVSVLSAAISVTVVDNSTHTDVLTYKNDSSRTGANLNESILTTANVKSASFGLLRVLPADGAVYAQPLYLSQLTVGGSPHNVVFIVTEHDSAYAYDSDSGAQLWHVPLTLSGETSSDDRSCDQITPEIGATATPVIDRSAGAIYVVAMSKDKSGVYHQRLHALDVTTGSELFGGPREIQASYPTAGGGTTTFDPGAYKERAGLLLLNGEVYTSWTSHCDDNPYTGWMIAYDQKTLAQTRVFNIAPNSDGLGPSIWMSGAAPSADSAGNIYVLAGNGVFETSLDANGFPNAQDYGNSFLKISTANNTLAVADYFTMWNEVSESAADLDLGGTGALLLPDLTDSAGAVQHLAVGAGKDGNIYVVNRDSLGKFNPTRNAIWQELDLAVPNGMRSTAAYFDSHVYLSDRDAPLKAFTITAAKLSLTPTAQTTVSFGYPGTVPVVSANGTQNGIVWGAEVKNPGVLHAFDANNLANELYNSNQAASGRDQYGAGNKYVPPTVADGKVFMAGKTGVGVFGLLP
jgi:fibronectin type 3 domain-containing protein